MIAFNPTIAIVSHVQSIPAEMRKVIGRVQNPGFILAPLRIYGHVGAWRPKPRACTSNSTRLLESIILRGTALWLCQT